MEATETLAHWHGLGAMILSFAVWIGFFSSVIAPWVRKTSVRVAIPALLWIHGFRYVALNLVAAQLAGFPMSDGLRNEVMYGDLVGMSLALLAIYAYRKDWNMAGRITWVFIGLGVVVDLTNSAIGAISEGLFAHVNNLNWLILVTYIPLLWVSAGFIAWRLLIEQQGR